MDRARVAGDGCPGEEQPEISRRVLAAADGMARCCGARLELLYAPGPADVVARQCREQQLARLGATAGVTVAAAHVLNGEAAAIAARARAHDYEILVLGALAHRQPQVGSLTGRLLEELDCDLLLVRPPAQ